MDSSAAAAFSSRPVVAAARWRAWRMSPLPNASDSARCASIRRARVAEWYAAERISGCTNSMRPKWYRARSSISAGSRSPRHAPSFSAASAMTAVSPVSSAAATSSSVRVASGSAMIRSVNACRMREVVE